MGYYNIRINRYEVLFVSGNLNTPNKENVMQPSIQQVLNLVQSLSYNAVSSQDFDTPINTIYIKGKIFDIEIKNWNQNSECYQ